MPKSSPPNNTAAKLGLAAKKRPQTAAQSAQAVQQAMLDIASLGGHVKNLHAFYQDIHQIISRLMYAENIYIALVSNDQEYVSFEYYCDEADENEDPTQWEPEPLSQFKRRLTGYILKTGQSLLADSAKLEELVKQGELEIHGQHASFWLGVPLIHDNQSIGVLAVQSYDDSIGYSDDDKRVLTFVAQQIASAIKQKIYEKQLTEINEKLEQKVADRTARLQKINLEMEVEIQERKRAEKLHAALFKISELTNTAKDLDEFYISLHKIIDGIMPSKNFYIAVVNEEKTQVNFPYFSDEYESDQSARPIDLTIPIEKLSPTEQVIKSGKPILINKNNRDKWVKSGTFKGMVPQTWLGVPLTEKDTVFGVLTIQSYSEDKSYNQLDEEVMTFVSQQVSTALTRRKSSENLRKTHEQLKQINDELEQRVTERTNELSITNSSLKSMLNERQKMQEKLSHEAFHDNLTGLPNRSLFSERLHQVLKDSQRNINRDFSVFFLDLDRFKVINDSLGHLMGDQLLIKVSSRLLECVRPGDTVARLGGDEFCILLNNISKERDAAIIANRILAAISRPFMLKEQKVFTSTSIGITLNTKNYTNAEEVLRDADAAMYHAKAQGKDRYALFDIELHDNAMKRLRIESELRFAIEQSAIQVYYQPIIDLRNNKIVAFEALARWLHPELGFISPDEFIPIAEETGLIHSLGKLILKTALADLASWKKQTSVASNVTMSVNFSSKQIENHDLFNEIKSALSQCKVKATDLKVEITESLLIENAHLAQKLLKNFADTNIPVLLDDFGTGYSSLSYLHKFELDTIKIDRSFIYAIEKNDKHLAIVKTIAFMASHLNLNVIAEGVETLTHANILRELDIRFAQGYHFGKPSPAAEAYKLMCEVNN
ncbi:bifunctional diguanylate cyclase/phosphodiesterase [Aliikangiella sp. IMCC44653]